MTWSLCLLVAAAGNAQTRLVLDPGNTISTLAGSGRDAKTVAGVAADTPLGSPRGLAYDAAGNLYLADSRNHQIDRISSAGALTVVAGTGSQGYAGDGGPATAAELNAPTALVLAADGAIYFADTGNHSIRRITNGTITTVAGSGAPGFNGDGGTATAARLRSPSGLALAADGGLYIADTGNHRIRKLATNGTIVTVAGTGTEDDTGDGGSAVAATFRSPGALQVLPDGRLLIADRDAHRIRALLTDGTLAAYATGSALRRPEGMGADAAGNLLIADAGNQHALLSGSDATGAATSSTLAGTGTQGAAASGAATATALDSPAAATANANGDVAISDRRNHQVQRVSLASLAFGNISAGHVSTPQTLTLVNGGDTPLQVSALVMPQGFAAAAAGTTCPAVPFPLLQAMSCGVGIVFSPIAQGQQNAFLQVKLTGAPAASVVLTGNGTASGSLAATVTTLTGNGSISYAGSPVTFSSVVTGSLAAPPAGNVTLLDGSAPFATVALTAGAATFSTAAMQSGQHTLHATYSGDALNAASTSQNITQNVVIAPDFTISAAASTYSGKAGGGITIPLVLVPVNGTLNHLVQVTVSGVPVGATALITPSTLTLGGAPVNLSLAITMPTTLARNESNGLPTLAALFAACLFLPLRLTSHKTQRTVRLAALALITICAGGCGGGFRGTATSTNTGSTTKTFNYTAVITATTTGVLGDPLTHTATAGLVVTQ